MIHLYPFHNISEWWGVGKDKLDFIIKKNFFDAAARH
jgi:hypothetical protein